LIEGKFVTPSIPIELSPGQLIAGEDTRMQKGLELAKSYVIRQSHRRHC
jgi:hypothetical protein